MIRRFSILLAISLVIAFIGVLTFAMFGANGLVFLTWLVISTLPVILIRSSKWLVFAKLATLFLLSQFVLLPLVYSILLNNNPNNFEVDSFIQTEESKSAFIDAIEKFKPEKTQQAVRLLITVLRSGDERLGNHFIDETKQTLEFSSGNLLIKVHATDVEQDLELCSLDGNILRTFNYNHLSSHDFKSISVNNVLREMSRQLAQSQTGYLIEIDKLKRQQIWNYSRILPYSVNMVGVSNLVPKTRVANIIYTIQFFLMNGILLSLIISAVYQYLVDRGGNN